MRRQAFRVKTAADRGTREPRLRHAPALAPTDATSASLQPWFRTVCMVFDRLEDSACRNQSAKIVHETAVTSERQAASGSGAR
jgi:hypothetical protein